MNRYHIQAVGPGGLYDESFANTLPELEAAVTAMARTHCAAHVCVCNLDACDEESSGLTDEERELVDETLAVLS